MTNEFTIKQKLEIEYFTLKLAARIQNKETTPELETFAKTVTIVGYEEILDPEHRVKEEPVEEVSNSWSEHADWNYGPDQCWRCGSYKKSPTAVCSECGEW